jgi:hypothetical protein
MSSEEDPMHHDLRSIFWTKSSYHHFANSFHPYHKHDLNALTHVFTSGLGFWGAIQLVLLLVGESSSSSSPSIPSEAALWIVWAYAAIIAATTPLVTAAFHTAFVYGCLQVSIAAAWETYLERLLFPLENLPHGAIGACWIAMGLGFGLQDLIHYLCAENTLLSTYIRTKPSTLLVHTVWLMPLVIDCVLLRHFYVPKLFVSRNRNHFCKVASKEAVENLREWINQNVPETPVRCRNRSLTFWFVRVCMGLSLTVFSSFV